MTTGVKSPAAPRAARAGVAAGVVAALLGCIVLLASPPAAAEIRRYALLVGANRGHASEEPLRYAESDVHAVAETLTAVGDFASERIIRVVGAPAERVRAALVDLSLRIQEDVRSGTEAVLFVYYSGHADARALHLGGTELRSDELAKLVRLAPARLKVLLVDACRSGALTRVKGARRDARKGGRQVAPLSIAIEDNLRNEGFALITSSAAGEDAQESDELRSSIFTHHFLTALRGPGDVNQDRLVTLGEAYAYAYEQALKTSSLTVAGLQHATFEYDLRGRADPVLGDLRARGDAGQLVLETPGDYLVMDRAAGTLLVEASARARGAAIVLPPGAYQIRLRTKTNVYEGPVVLSAGGSAVASAASLRPLPLARVVRKGETDVHLAIGPSAAATLHGPLGSGYSPMLGINVAWAFELPRLTLLPRLGVARGSGIRRGGEVDDNELSELSLEFAALYVLDIGRLSLAPLVSVGWAALWQRVSLGPTCVQARCTYTVQPQALLTTLGAHAALPLGRGFALEAVVELASFYLRRQQDRQGLVGSAGWAGTLTYRTSVGVGYRY